MSNPHGMSLIERLERMSDRVAGDCIDDLTLCRDAKAEIERLKASHIEYEKRMVEVMAMVNLRDKEIERLRAALEYVRGALNEGYHIPQECQKAVLEALNEQVTK